MLRFPLDLQLAPDLAAVNVDPEEPEKNAPAFPTSPKERLPELVLEPPGTQVLSEPIPPETSDVAFAPPIAKSKGWTLKRMGRA